MKLEPNKEQAALLLAFGVKKRVVAKKVGVTPQTISEWLKCPDFEIRVNQEKEVLLERTRDRMRLLGPKAINTLLDVMNNSKNPVARLKAVEIVLHHIGYTDPQTMLWAWGIGTTDK